METKTQSPSKLEIGQELTFNVYENEIKGTFTHINNDIITISVTHDSYGISIVGDEATIHKSFLVNQININQTIN